MSFFFSTLDDWKLEFQGRNGNATPELPAIVPLTLLPPEPQGFILNGSFSGLHEVNSCSEAHFETRIKLDICCLRTFNTHLTNSSLCSCSSNSYCAWMRLQALGSLFGSLGPCLMSSVRNMTLVQQIKGLDGSWSYCGTVLLTKHEEAWSRGSDTFHFLDFISDTDTHTFRCPPMCEHQCPQDRL